MQNNLRSKAIAMLLSFVMLAPNMGRSETTEERVLSDVKKFRWGRLDGGIAPCPSLECRLIWASIAMAKGDVGGYARRVRADGMREYARSQGISQDFEKVGNLETLASVTPGHISKKFTVKFANTLPSGREWSEDFKVDSRIFVEILVNNSAINVILDSGATLTLPSGTVAAESLDLHNMPTKNTSGLGKTEINSLATAKKVSIGGVDIRNLMVKKKDGLPTGDMNAVGLLGYDLLLRFDRVTVDLREGLVKFNPAQVQHLRCSPMEMAIDNDRLPAGITVDVLIDDTPFKARIDTGANVDVVVHGKNTMPFKNGKPSLVIGVDSGGNASGFDTFEAKVSLDREAERHTVLRSPYPHADFEATLGVKFFAGRSFTFDFKNQQFCLD